MNHLTVTVLELQEAKPGTYEWDRLYGDVYMYVSTTIEKMVESFSRQLKGDTQQGHSEALTQLMTSIESFEYKGYEFSTYFRRILKNRLIDLARTLSADKMRHYFDLSFDYMLSDEEGSRFTADDRFQDTWAQVNDVYTCEEPRSLQDLLSEFESDKPQEAGVIDLLITYSAEGYTKNDLTTALKEYYGSETYSVMIQKRVSRARGNFKKFLKASGYPV